MVEKKAIMLLLEIGKLSDQEYILMENKDILSKQDLDITKEEIPTIMSFLKENEYIKIKFSDSKSYFLGLTEIGRQKIKEINQIIEQRKEEKRLEQERLAEQEREKQRKWHSRVHEPAESAMVEECEQDYLPENFDQKPVEEKVESMLPVVVSKKENVKKNALSSVFGFFGGLIGGGIILLIAILL